MMNKIPRAATFTRWSIVVAALVVAAGCGKSEDKARAPQAPVPQATAPVPAPVTSQTTQQPAAAPPPTASAAPAVATTDGETSGARIEIQEFKRSSGGSVTLRFSLINDSDKAIGMWGYLYGGLGGDAQTVAGVTLVDPVGKKKYFVLRDSEGACLCSRAVPDVTPKGRLNMWAKFPAPPDDVQKISVIVPHFAPMDDV